MQCIFVHGWGMNSAVWDGFIQQLPDYIEPVCIDLPGHGQFSQQGFESLQDLVDHLSTQTDDNIKESAIWVGWSLGALPVLALAKQQPDKVKKLVLMASNPCFVIREDWQAAVEDAVFDQFADNLQENTEKTLQRFLSLQVRGLADSREVLRTLRAAIVGQGLPTSTALTAGLEVLKTTDLRAMVSDLEKQQLWLLGETDSLVPAQLNDYLSVQAGVKSHIIGGSAHLPFVSHTEDVMQRFLNFIND